METPDFDRLAAEFPPERVAWRVGPTNGNRGMALAYIDARDVMERLDDVCGPAGWQCKYSHANGKTVCDIGIKVDDEWIWKADGAGDTDMEGIKGALSDAFKRAAVRWGIGRYLYEFDSPWVEIQERGRSKVIVPHELAKLQRGKPQPEEVADEDDTAWSVFADDLKAKINRADTSEALSDLWLDKKTQQDLAALMQIARPLYDDLVSTKDGRKRELSQKEAA